MALTAASGLPVAQVLLGLVNGDPSPKGPVPFAGGPRLAVPPHREGLPLFAFTVEPKPRGKAGRKPRGNGDSPAAGTSGPRRHPLNPGSPSRRSWPRLVIFGTTNLQRTTLTFHVSHVAQQRVRAA